METMNGDLLKPGVMGRIGRFIFGLGSIWVLLNLLPQAAFFMSNEFPDNLSYWFIVGITFLVLHEVINIGFNVAWGRQPQVAFLGAGAIAIVLDLIFYGTVWAWPLNLLIFLLLVYTHLHLGVSHLLAVVLGTPGCEMRAIPHLRTLVWGGDVQAQVCPGHWDAVDRWEAKQGRQSRSE